MKVVYFKPITRSSLTGLIVMLSLQYGACETPAEKVVSRQLAEQREGVTYLKGEDEPFTGTLTEDVTVDEGARARFSFLNGIPHGHQRLWHASGELFIEYNAVKGKRHGYSRSWFYSGNLSSEEHYDKGLLPSGPFRSWHDNGQLAVVGQYEDDEVRAGFWVWFHENGRPKQTGYFRDGKRDGLWVEWNEEGEEVSRKYFSSDLDKEITEEEWFLSAVKRQSESE